MDIKKIKQSNCQIRPFTYLIIYYNENEFNSVMYKPMSLIQVHGQSRSQELVKGVVLNKYDKSRSTTYIFTWLLET